MAETVSPDPPEPKEQVEKSVWPRLVVLIGAIGSGFAYIVGNWTEVEPVLSSPAILIVSMLSLYGLGGLSAYWLVARPLEYRLGKAEGVIKRMRDRERELGDQISELRVELAKMEIRIDLMGTAPKQP